MAFAFQTNAGHADPAIDPVESDFLTLINQYRADNGRQPLSLNLQLNASSDWYACDMATDNYWHHDHSDNENPQRFPPQRAAYFGYSGGVGENIAGGFNTAADVIAAWKSSSGHNANMLNANYKIIGIARYYDPSSTYRWYWVTDFGFGPSPGNPPTQPMNCPLGAPTTITPTPVPTTPGQTAPPTTPGVTVTPTPLPTPGGEGAAAVFLTRVVCAGSPEYVRIKNYGSTPVSLSGFRLRSDPVAAQDFDLAAVVPSIAGGQEIELRSGPGATADPDNGVYVLSTAELYRDFDSTDFAYLVRPVPSNVLGFCSSVTPSPTPTPGDETETPVPTLTVTPQPTHEGALTWADLDCNDYLSFVDPMAILEAAAGVTAPTGGGCPLVGEDVIVNGGVWKWGDVNCSGAVNAKDAVDLLTYLGHFDLPANDPSCPSPGMLF